MVDDRLSPLVAAVVFTESPVSPLDPLQCVLAHVDGGQEPVSVESLVLGKLDESFVLSADSAI